MSGDPIYVRGTLSHGTFCLRSVAFCLKDLSSGDLTPWDVLSLGSYVCGPNVRGAF